ncbi:hypothetical protein I7I50_04401 [Histoplasma capsulatum G186AR]|uniref:Uncharacterized protein n=1 Tax=Ajellomyces capsulatus TaxID=5037 RepID=A0A8H7YQK7_AJECA|nr:hypothetical protein I7I52_05309 [Histoplasma capsulatum]QSS75301.1 hypothetical protein I7I50_04401 [Histoplasma capsulatum G186AR]
MSARYLLPVKRKWESSHYLICAACPPAALEACRESHAHAPRSGRFRPFFHRKN